MSFLTRFFGDANHKFGFTPDTILELERVTATGIGSLCRRMFAGQFGLAEIQSVIRLALIGGGTSPQEAAGLVAAYVGIRPLEESFELAVAILENLYFGKAEADGQA